MVGPVLGSDEHGPRASDLAVGAVGLGVLLAAGLVGGFTLVFYTLRDYIGEVRAVPTTRDFMRYIRAVTPDSCNT
jgi:uncharacterized membrane-anchored protein